MTTSASDRDHRTVPLPQPFRRAVALLVRRTIGVGDYADGTVNVLFGDTPVFGGLLDCSKEDVMAACSRLTVKPALVTGPKDCADLLRRVTPRTPVCTKCGEFPLSSVGGKISELPDGSRCPFCTDGTAKIVPMTLRKLAWTDGRLVAPQESQDFRAVPGHAIPLDDEGILAWLDGKEEMDRWLARALHVTNTPIYAFLAYANLARKRLDRTDDAIRLLRSPKDFGLETPEQMEDAAKRSAHYVANREETNLPAMPVLAALHGIRRSRETSITLGERTYLIEKHTADDKHRTFRAFWDNTPTERVVIKIGHETDGETAARMENERRILARLNASTVQGDYHFTMLLPHVISAWVWDEEYDRPVTVFRYKSRFDWTLADVIREYPEGVDPKTMVWMWNRILMLLGWVHMNRIAHGELLPENILLNVQTHGALFTGWDGAGAFGSPVTKHHRDGMEPTSIDNTKHSAARDIAMTARCMIAVLGGDPATGRIPASVPKPIVDIILAHAGSATVDGSATETDALELHERFGKVTKAVYGKREFVPFHMPRR